MSWKKAHILSKWILFIGIAPIQYIFAISIVLAILITAIPNLEKLLNLIPYASRIGMGIVIIGFLIYLYFVIKRLKSEPLDEIKFKFRKVKIGIIIDYIGHIGLISSYGLLFYGLSLPGGSFSGLFLLPFIFWMLFFYTISFAFTSLNRETYQTIKLLTQYYEDKVINENEYQTILASLYVGKDIQLPKALKKYKNHPSIIIDEDEDTHTITISNASKNTYQNLKSELLEFYALHGLSIVIYDKETSWMIQNEQKNAYVSLNFDSKKNQIIIQWYKTDIPDFDVNTLQLLS